MGLSALVCCWVASVAAVRVAVPRRVAVGRGLAGFVGVGLPQAGGAAAPGAGFVGGRSASTAAAPQFVERELGFPWLDGTRLMYLTQAFGAARGAARDAADAGDRTGTYAWPGGVALARHLAAFPALVRGKRVLELGCGTGAAGIMAQWLGASRPRLTDGSPAVLENTVRNVGRNVKRGRGGPCEVARLRWGYAADIRGSGPGTWDVVLAAEVAYQRETLPALLDTVAQLLAPDGRALLQLTPELADNGRGLAGVKDLIAQSRLALVDVALPRDDDDDDGAGDDGTARFTLSLRR